MMVEINLTTILVSVFGLFITIFLTIITLIINGLKNGINRLETKIDKVSSTLEGKIDKISSDLGGKIDTIAEDVLYLKLEKAKEEGYEKGKKEALAEIQKAA